MSRRKQPGKTSWTCYVVIWEPNIRPYYEIVILPGHHSLIGCAEAGREIGVEANRRGLTARYACQFVESSSGPNARERDAALGAMLDVPRQRTDEPTLLSGGIIA